MLWFDFTLTFPMEVRRIWGRKFSGVTLVYLVTRYTSLADSVLIVVGILLWNSSDQVSERSGGLLHAELIVFPPRPVAGFRAPTT